MSMDLSRRGLLKGGLTLGCSAAAFPLMSKVTFASAPGDNRLVVIVLRGALELTMNGQTRHFGPGESYDIPAGVEHGARVAAGSQLIDVFEEHDRYPVKSR